MASSNIKLFDENKGNMLSDSEFSISNQRMNGLQTGVASSQLQNKAMYQASLIAYAIAQVMMQNGKNANDTDAVSAFVANLSGTMLQKVYDIATTEEAKAGVATGKWMSPALVKASIDKTLNDKNFLQKSGGTMTGNLILNANPTAKLGAATKQYVDSTKSSLQTNINNVNSSLSAQITKLYSGVTTTSATLNADSIEVTGSNQDSPFYSSDYTLTYTFNIKYANTVRLNFEVIRPGGSTAGTKKAYSRLKSDYYVNNTFVESHDIALSSSFAFKDYSPGKSGQVLNVGDVLKIVTKPITTSERSAYDLGSISSLCEYSNYYYT